ncbi:MAG: hypothetical protein IRZ11_01120 [Clostridia bacterium]|nr:hypothetical protein [Clostridia bacterium]
MRSEADEGLTAEGRAQIRPRRAPWRAFLFAWLLMVAWTVLAFALVGLRLLPRAYVGWSLLLLGAWQVVLQLTLFMHLGRTSRWYLVYFGMGAHFAVIWVLAIWYLVWVVR